MSWGILKKKIATNVNYHNSQYPTYLANEEENEGKDQVLLDGEHAQGQQHSRDQNTGAADDRIRARIFLL